MVLEGEEIEDTARKFGLTVIPAFAGHGIGSYFHGPPDIYHCYNSYPGRMLPGMTFTIEPVITQGSENIVILEDGWTAVMEDTGRAAQFEHTVLITETGSELTDLWCDDFPSNRTVDYQSELTCVGRAGGSSVQTISPSVCRRVLWSKQHCA
uniref:Peptidase M24 domain-containing protein n=1 Tax=Timema douglasi TaxID=61478 RepID=A0A7R8VC37_TIMDO|nr:unnamed protein product [Timema douglasi]